MEDSQFEWLEGDQAFLGTTSLRSGSQTEPQTLHIQEVGSCWDNKRQCSGMTPSWLFFNSHGSSQTTGEWGRAKAIIPLPQLESQLKLGDKPRTTASFVSTHQDANEQESALCTGRTGYELTTGTFPSGLVS